MDAESDQSTSFKSSYAAQRIQQYKPAESTRGHSESLPKPVTDDLLVETAVAPEGQPGPVSDIAPAKNIEKSSGFEAAPKSTTQSLPVKIPSGNTATAFEVVLENESGKAVKDPESPTTVSTIRY